MCNIELEPLSSKVIEWLRWDHPLLVYEENDSRNEMRLNPWPGSGNIREVVLNDFLLASLLK